MGTHDGDYPTAEGRAWWAHLLAVVDAADRPKSKTDRAFERMFAKSLIDARGKAIRATKSEGER